jgi:hypothetical protein
MSAMNSFRLGSLRTSASIVGATLFTMLAFACAPAFADGKTYALVSLVGDRVSFSKQKKSTGTHLEPIERATVKVNDTMAIDAAVLRGLDRILGRAEPDAKRIFLRVTAPQLQEIRPSERNEAALDFVTGQLRNLPQRAHWDRIYVVTPSYRYSDLPGLGSKINGVGVFVQPLTGVTSENPLDIVPATQSGEFETIDENGKPNERGSDIYVALYFVTQLTVLDAHTLQVIETRENITQQKIYDFNWTAIDLSAAMKPEVLAARMESFVERAAARSMYEVLGTGAVTSGELKPVETRPAAPPPAQTAPQPATR